METRAAYRRSCIVLAALLFCSCPAHGNDAPVAAPAPASQPIPPAWMADEPSRWPQILLGNDIRLKSRVQISGANGFLLRLPNGAVVAVTAKHVIDQEVKLDQLDASLSSWTMYPPTMPDRKVSLGKVAMNLDAAGSLDCLLLTVSPMSAWPVEVRPPRTTPLEVGQTVYLLAVPYEQRQKIAQNVYPGVVRRCFKENQFFFQFEGTVKTEGFSGAPILDADGNVAGLCLGHVNNPPPGKTIGWGLDITAVVALADVPPPGTAMPPAASAADNDAVKAARALEMARSLVTLRRYEAARSRLEMIMQTWPGTPTAKEAEDLLQQIEGR